MKITLGYDLPFSVHVFTTTEGLLRLRVRCKPGTRHRSLMQLQVHGAIFVEAALLGMGAGAMVPPRLDPRSVDDVLRTSTTGVGPEVVLDAPVIVGPSYATVLLHKLLGLSEQVAIEEVMLELPGLSATRRAIVVERGESSVLPELHAPLPFAFADERSGHADTCTLRIVHESAPGEAELEVLRHALRVWLAQALQGGFISPPMGPDDTFVSADEAEVHGDEVIWVLESCDVAPDGLRGLVNALVAYHRQVARLREVSLE
jgi:hypothetical protein